MTTATAEATLTAEVVAERIWNAMARIEGSQATLYFTEDGSRLAVAGRAFYRGRPADFAIAITYPHRPSVRSLCDLVEEHRRTGRPVTYSEATWWEDRRVEEAAGPSVISGTFA